MVQRYSNTYQIILLKEKKVKYQNRYIYPIMALKTFSIGQYTIRKGTIGGYVESRRNIVGVSWVFPHSIVTGNSKITNSIIEKGSIICNANIEYATISNSQIIGNSKGIIIKSSVIDNTYVYDEAFISGAFIAGPANEIFKNAHIESRDNIISLVNVILGENAFITNNNDCISQGDFTLYRCNDKKIRYYYKGNCYILTEGPKKIEEKFIINGYKFI